MSWVDRVRSEGLHVHRGVYDLRLDAAGGVSGTATVEGNAISATGRVAFAVSPGLTVTAVQVNGTARPAEVDGVCAIEASSATGLRLQVHVAYEGRLTQAFMRDAGGHPWYELQSMTGWRPRFALDAPSASRVTLTAPATFAAVSSFGLVEHRRTPEAVHCVWDTRDAALEDFALAVGDGRSHDETTGPVELRALCQWNAPCNPRGVVAAATAAVRAYAQWWGPCPFPRITLACLPHASCGNCSRPGLALFGHLNSDPMADPGAFALLCHEVCHQWWGLGVGFDEAASLGYLEALAHYGDERLMRDRFGENAFRTHMAEYLLPAARAAETAAGVSLRDCRYDTPESSSLRQRKGAAVMLLLERLVGRVKMDAALSNLLHAFEGRTATPADVRRIFVEVGGAPVDRFFDDYFDGVVPIPADLASYGE